MWKARPELSDAEIEQVFDEVEKAEEWRSGGLTTKQQFTKRAELWAHITKEATLKAAAEAAEEGVPVSPERIAAIRGNIVGANEHLQQALDELPGDYEEPALEAEPEVQKGADVLAEHAAEVEKLKTDPRVLAVPEHSRLVKARLLAWEKPGLQERYQKALRS
jgi:hypothetical protein